MTHKALIIALVRLRISSIIRRSKARRQHVLSAGSFLKGRHGNICWGVLRVYLFDLDDTLVDRRPSLEAFLPEQYARYRTLDVPAAAFVERFFILDRGGHAPKHDLYKILSDEFELSAPVAELVADFRMNAFKACALQPGALGVLEQLRQRGVRLGVVTNGSVAAQQQKLDASGIAPFLEARVISEAVGLRKPDPAIFLEAASRLGAEPAACVFVGDHPEKDIVGAQGAGMRTVWLRHGRTWPEQLRPQPTFEVSQLEELLTLPSCR